VNFAFGVMREANVESYLVLRAERLGALVRKVRWVGRRGAPDRLIMLCGQTIFVEVKAPGGRLSPHQIKEHHRLRQQGMRVEVVASKEEVDTLCETLSLPVTETTQSP
jgi:hypothetical protein